MIRLLVLIQVLDVVGSDVSSPLNIEVRIGRLHHGEACVLARVDHRVVDVRRVRYLERHEQVLDLFSVVDANSV